MADETTEAGAQPQTENRERRPNDNRRPFRPRNDTRTRK